MTIESTPELVTAVYERMARTLARVRQRRPRPLTLAEKLLLSHLDDPGGAEPERGRTHVLLRPDRVILQDVLGQTAMLQFMQTGRPRTAVPTTIHCDHLVEARTAAAADLEASRAENREVYDFLRSAAARYGAGFWSPGAGIIHQVTLENYAFPGALLIGTDSHTPNAGGLGACAVGVGGAEAVEVMAGLPWEVLFPRVIGVRLRGALQGWTAPKDVILRLAALLTVAGGTNAVLEYFGPGARSLSATGKATIANMGAELGATTSVFPYDAAMARYLAATGRGALAELAEAHRDMLVADPEVEAQPERLFDRVVEIDLETLPPHMVGPHSPDRARPIERLAAEVGDPRQAFVDAISTALIGSCTNSSYEDMSRAAAVAEQARAHGLDAAVPLLVTPGSEQVRATVERDGQLPSLRAIGATVLASACGPCIGQWRGTRPGPGEPRTIVTSYNRNFPMRNDGQAATMNFIGSPEIVTALALAGRLSFNPLTDTLTGADGRPFRLEPPGPAPDVPPRGFARDRRAYVAPPENGAAVEVVIDPRSERLQRMAPWPAWDGCDLLDLPVLVKTRGTTTTDQIAPAGPWLRLRGHLERFSDNMFMGAVNAFTGERGRGRNLLTGERGQALADIARHYRAQGLRWVVVGDHNYGEGSSREHAAQSPRLLGGAAVIARSFARIHESNLKKQGLLALTFRDPADYEQIREDDRLSLVGLADLAPGVDLGGILRHADGTTVRLRLHHSYTAAQVAWFRRGSALNLFTTTQRATEGHMALRINSEAPNFTAETTQGKIDFHDWIGNGWAILFSHPKDFTPVCTTELGYMAGLKPEFDKRNCKIIGLSVDPVDDHKRWAKDIEETQGHAVTYPMIGDPDLQVAKAYDMLPEGAGTSSQGRTPADNATVRSVFVIGPDKKVKAMLTYPMSTGRNFDEVLRLLDSCQLTAKHQVATPVNWKQGGEVIISPAVKDEDAKKAYPAGWKAPKPYIRLVPQPK